MEMRDLRMEDLFLFGLGSALLTREKLKGFAEELSHSRSYTREEGKKFLEEAIARGREEWQRGEAGGWFQRAVKDAVANLDLATKEDLERVKQEIIAALHAPR